MKMNKKKITLSVLVIGLLISSPLAYGVEIEEITEQSIRENDKNTNSKSYWNTVSDLLHKAIDRGQGFVTPFSRGAGYWTNPEQEKNSDYFVQLAEQETQREDWYKVTKYISEFWCSISNLPLIYVGIHHKSPAVAFAGCASMLYHSCPKQWLLHVDRLGVLLTFLTFAKEYKTIQKNPKLLALPVGVIGVNLADVYLGQYKGHTWSHAAWHLSAAWFAHIFLSHVKK